MVYSVPIEKEGHMMYFNERVFNPQYINPLYYSQVQNQIAQYNFQQDQEVMKAVHAVHDLCEAVKKMDEQHQQQAFFACLAEMASEFHWNP